MCRAVSAVEVLVRGPVSPGAVEYVVQAGVATLDGDGAHAGWPTRVNGPVLSVTAGSPEWRLDDLLPDTNYEFRMRVRSEWSERPWEHLGRPMRCATLPLRPRQALLLPPTDAPSNDSFLVLLRLPPDASSTELAIEGAGGTIRRSVEPLDQRERTFTHRVGGLRASTAYLVTATASFADGSAGDATVSGSSLTAQQMTTRC